MYVSPYEARKALKHTPMYETQQIAHRAELLKEKQIMKIAKTMIGIVVTCVLGAGGVAAQQPAACSTGKLVGLDTRIQTIAGMNTAHYEERAKKNGKRTIDEYIYNGEQTQEIYVLTVAIGDMIYTAESSKNLFFGYNPTDMVVNDPIDVCVEKNKLVLTRPDGKPYKARIVRSERDPEVFSHADRLAAGVMSSK